MRSLSARSAATSRCLLLCIMCHLVIVQAIWTPLAAKFNVYADSNNEISVETDFNLGYWTEYIGKPSDY